MDERDSGVGPVLTRGPLTQAVLRAIEANNDGVNVIDRGAYVRVLAPRRCVLRRADVERETGAAFRLPSDLESIMPSFKGRMHLGADQVVWEFAERSP